MDTKELEVRVMSLDDRLRMIEDVEEIENLQIMYGYYLDYYMWDEMQDLFSENTESMELGTSGVYLGKVGVVRLCQLLKANRLPKEDSLQGEPQGMAIPRVTEHAIMMEQPVIDVDAGNSAAYGRWQVLECVGRPVGGTWVQYWGQGIYENQYIKEDGRWWYKKLRFHLTYHTPYEDGWLKTPNMFNSVHPIIKPDRPTTGYHLYPEVCTVPFHYKYPRTGN